MKLTKRNGMGNKKRTSGSRPEETKTAKNNRRRQISHGHHECEVFQWCGQREGAESQYKWKNCPKNPGHANFISAREFKDNLLPKVQDVWSRRVLRPMIDLTVRLRVHYTSTARPDDDEFCQGRGSHNLRTGTGWIDYIFPPEVNKPCPCVTCAGSSCAVKKHWGFLVRTAHHVVFDTAEAKETKVDLFFDDESCDRDSGKMASVWGVNVAKCDPAGDRCYMLCVTCHEDVGEWIESALRCYDDGGTTDLNLTGLDLPPTGEEDCVPALIISHPHGQSKQISMGELRKHNDRLNYTVPTCPGCSGAPVFRFRYNHDTDRFDVLPFFYPSVHSGSYCENSSDRKYQLNYGFWFLCLPET